MAIAMPMKFIVKITDLVKKELNLSENAIIQSISIDLATDKLPVIDLKVALKGKEETVE